MTTTSKGMGDTHSGTTDVIDLFDVSRVFRTGAVETVALAKAELNVRAGEFVAIVGKSGSGKSTLLNMISGIDRPTAGMVRVGGAELAALDENQIAKWRGSTVGLVFQFQQLLPTLTVVENVILPMDFLGELPRPERRDRAETLLARVGMGGFADRFPADLSGGEMQRVAIARALANDPPLIAADEPTGNLDSATADSVLELFRDLAGSGKAVVMVTHERDIARWADRVVTVRDGRIVSDHNGDRTHG